MLSYNRFRQSYNKLVDRYIALTQFSAGRLKEGGLPSEKIVIKPNFIPSAPQAGKGDGNYVIYVGRLSEEKGLRTLLSAWRQLDNIQLKIVGDGPLREELETNARDLNLNTPIEFLGYRNRDEILNLLGAASLQVVPSEWYEGFPMVILEALASGTPVLASKIGSLDEIIIEGETGYKFIPGNADDLANKVKLHMLNNNHEALRCNARKQYEDNYSPEQNISQLLDIYNQVLKI